MGDIVLLKNDSSTRVFWKLARVEELISGADGKIRAAIVKGGNSERRSAYFLFIKVIATLNSATRWPRTDS